MEKETKDGRKVMKWTRFVHGTDIEIPKPTKRYDDVRSGKFAENFSMMVKRNTDDPLIHIFFY